MRFAKHQLFQSEKLKILWHPRNAFLRNRGDSGLLLMATEQSRVLSYYVPALGPAPRWCSFLDVLTEELEEEQEASVYEDYKFVTAAEVRTCVFSF